MSNEGGALRERQPGRNSRIVRRFLPSVLAVVLLLFVAELVRTLWFDLPRSYEVGFYAAEWVELERGWREFRWTRGESGEIRRPLYGRVVRIPLYVARPDLGREGVDVQVLVEGEVRDRVTIYRAGWHTFDYYVPALLGRDPWAAGPESMSLDGYAALEAVPGDEPFLIPRLTWQRAPDYVRVFTGWRESPGPPSTWFGFLVDSVFVPAEEASATGGDATGRAGADSDWRRLGIGVGELLWLPDLPEDGLGLHSWEESEAGAFAWSKARASLPLLREAGANRLRVRFRPSPDPDPTPRVVSFYWNGNVIDSLTMGNPDLWTEVLLTLPPAPPNETPGVLTVDVSRTWSPARAGVAVDGRELGVALQRPEWMH